MNISNDADRITSPSGEGTQDPAGLDSSSFNRELLNILLCPLTKTELVHDQKTDELISQAAGLAYPIRDGIPVMLVDEARSLDGKPTRSGSGS